MEHVSGGEDNNQQRVLQEQRTRRAEHDNARVRRRPCRGERAQSERRAAREARGHQHRHSGRAESGSLQRGRRSDALPLGEDRSRTAVQGRVDAQAATARLLLQARVRRLPHLRLADAHRELREEHVQADVHRLSSPDILLDRQVARADACRRARHRGELGQDARDEHRPGRDLQCKARRRRIEYRSPVFYYDMMLSSIPIDIVVDHRSFAH